MAGIRAFFVVLAMMYALQGCLVGLSELTIPQLLSGKGGNLTSAKILAIVKVPPALKIFASPFIDMWSVSTPGGLKSVVISLQVVTCASLLAVLPQLQFGEDTLSAAFALRWPLFGIATLNALADLGMDSFALTIMPAHLRHLPAFAQVFGVYAGKLCSRSGFRLMMNMGLTSLPGFVFAMALVMALCAACMICIPTPARQAQELRTEDGHVITRTWEFCTGRPNVVHWLIYQLIMPAMYFHTVSFLPVRYEQLGFASDQYATYDIMFAVIVVGCMAYIFNMASDAAKPLTFFLQAYVVQALLTASQVLQYMMWPGTPTTLYSTVYSLLGRSQELMFYIFEFGEFAFYGRVAMLEPSLVSTLVTFQTSVFNFSDFFHSWLTISLVDHFSECHEDLDAGFVCQFDAYPAVAFCFWVLSLVFLATQWKRMNAYQNLQDSGWAPQAPSAWMKLLLVSLVVAAAVPVMELFWTTPLTSETSGATQQPLLEHRARQVFYAAMNYNGTAGERQLLDSYIEDVLDNTTVPNSIKSGHALSKYLSGLMLDEITTQQDYTQEMAVLGARDKRLSV